MTPGAPAEVIYKEECTVTSSLGLLNHAYTLLKQDFIKMNISSGTFPAVSSIPSITELRFIRQRYSKWLFSHFKGEWVVFSSLLRTGQLCPLLLLCAWSGTFSDLSPSFLIGLIHYI